MEVHNMSDYYTSTPVRDIRGAYTVAGYNVVVTGGSRGIGFGIAEAFAQGGANVAILDIAAEAAIESAEALAKKYDGKFAAFPVDVSGEESVTQAKAKVFEFFDHIDVLVNNAGVAPHLDFLEEGGLKEWRRVIDVDLHGVANMVHYFAPEMKKNKAGGSIINISSIGSKNVSESKTHPNSPYNVAKAGVDIFTQYLAIALGDYGIRVNAILPGPTHTDLDKNLPEETKASFYEKMPVHRFGEPIEIGALAVFLSSPLGVQITGTNIPHDGGMLVAW
jgi:NAD(P)-dependent dehydrogenase (short-subunit alcohol dehydrogenase family)